MDDMSTRRLTLPTLTLSHPTMAPPCPQSYSHHKRLTFEPRHTDDTNTTTLSNPSLSHPTLAHPVPQSQSTDIRSTNSHPSDITHPAFEPRRFNHTDENNRTTLQNRAISHPTLTVTSHNEPKHPTFEPRFSLKDENNRNTSTPKHRNISHPTLTVTPPSQFRQTPSPPTFEHRRFNHKDENNRNASTLQHRSVSHPTLSNHSATHPVLPNHTATHPTLPNPTAIHPTLSNPTTTHLTLPNPTTTQPTLPYRIREPRRLRRNNDVTERTKDGDVYLYPKARLVARHIRSKGRNDTKFVEDESSQNSATSFNSGDSRTPTDIDTADDSDSQTVYRNMCRTTPGIVFSRCMHAQLQLSTLSVCYHKIEPDEAKILATALSINNCVKLFEMRANQLCTLGLGYITAALNNNTSLQYLTVTQNSLGTPGAKLLRGTVTSNRIICYLNISDNGFEDDAMTEIFKAMETNKTLQVLKLNHNCFRESAGISLLAMLGKNRTLETLDLSWNHIRCKGAVSVAHGLARNRSLRAINLAWNGFGLEGCHEVGKALDRNTSLQELDLSSNRVCIDALRQLTKGLVHNSCLLVLKIGGNPITTDGAKEILHMIESTSIRELNMADVSVDSDFVTILKTMQSHRAISVTYGVTLRHDDVHRGMNDVVLDTDDPLLVLFELRRQKNLRLIDLLHAFDKDHSEDVTREEFADGFRSVDIPLSVRSLDILMKKLDHNRDGAIDYEELVQGQKDHNRRVAKMKMKAERKGEEANSEKYDSLRATMRVRIEASSRRGSHYDHDPVE